MSYPRIDHKIGLLNNAPVVYSAVMLRFPVEQRIGEYVSEISKSLKPDFVRAPDHSVNSFRIENTPQGSQQFESKTGVEYVFNTPEKTLGITLKEDILFIHATKYPGFERFSKKVRQLVEVISSIVGITHFTALGIRYIDAIVPSDGNPLEFYLKDFLKKPELSLTAELPNLTSQTTNVFQTELGRLILRTYKLQNEYCIPPDLQPTAQLLKPSRENMCIENEFMVIDTDHIFDPNEAIALDVTDLINRLDAMHTFTTAVFKDAVSEKGLKEWK